jgi:hypothetical protein
MAVEMLKQKYRAKTPVSELSEHPENPRRGDDESVTDSIESNGFYGAIIVQESTGYVLAGNTRYRSLTAAGNTTVPTFTIDCDDATAKRIMLYDNRSSDKARYDDPQLADLLVSLKSDQGDLLGTGYDEVDLELLLSAGQEPEPSGGYIPDEVPQDAYHEQYGVIVVCENEDHQQGVFKMLQDDGFDVRVVVT